jgi:hypothetical protein
MKMLLALGLQASTSPLGRSSEQAAPAPLATRGGSCADSLVLTLREPLCETLR